jgi:hypothetical protein
MPQSVANALLRRNLIIRPGPETRFPQETLNLYLNILQQSGRSIADKRVMIFGYGGHLTIACGLLQAGAGHVVACDKYVTLDENASYNLLSKYPNFLVNDGNQVKPQPEHITLLHADIRQAASHGTIAPFDIIFSTSVFEHLDNVDGITQALAALTAPAGLQLHYIDLSDHYFKYPFEMLTYSEQVWNAWLNPGSNLNRYRVEGYSKIFHKYFNEVVITILDRAPEKFVQVQHRIRPEFLTGNLEIDSATLVQVLAASPRKTN